MSLEHDNQLMFTREISRDFAAIRLNFCNAHAGQARHFSRMRSEDYGSPAAGQLVSCSLEGTQPVRIDHYRFVAAGDDCAHEFGGFGVTRDAWANRQRLALQQRIEA